MACAGVTWAPKGLSYFTAIASIIIAVFASVGNGLIILVIIKDPLKKFSSPFNFLLVNLAASDFLMGAIPISLAAAVHFQEANGYVRLDLVVAIHFSLFVTSTSSLLSLIAISVDRYFAIVKALEYRQRLSSKRCKIVSAVIWILSLSFATIYFELGYVNYWIFYTCSSVLLGVIITAFVYIKIGKHLRIQTVNMKRAMEASKAFEAKRMQDQKAVTRTFLVIMTAFLMIYIPVVIMMFTLQFCEQCDCMLRHSLRDVQALLTAFNSVVNPFVYAIRSKAYLKSIKRLFGKGKIAPVSKTNSSSKAKAGGTSSEL